MAEVNPCTPPPRRKSDVGPLRTWPQENAASPLQRLRQGPTFQPPRRNGNSAALQRSPVTTMRISEGEELEKLAVDRPDAGLEQEIAGLQKALALESRERREQFAVRRRLHQLQNVQAKQVHPQETSLAPQETAGELEKVKAALEELRRGGEEEKIHRNQLEERVMREIEDLKSSPTSPVTPMALTRSLSRQNLLAEERERKRFWANEQLHAEVQELQDALAELRVTSADEMEAQRLKEHQVLAASAEMKEQLSLAPAREEALLLQLREAEHRLQSEASEVQRLRRDAQEQDETLASFWALQTSFKHEMEEASRFRESTCNLEEEMQSLSRSQGAELRESNELAEEYEAMSSSLRQLPQSLQEELRVPAAPASSWCSAMQKLSTFAASVLQENAQLREKLQNGRSAQASADEAGGVELKGLKERCAAEDASRSASRSASPSSQLLEAHAATAKAEAMVKTLEKRLAKYEKGHSNGGLSVPSGPSRLRSPQKRRGPTAPSGGKGSCAREAPRDDAPNERNDRHRNGAAKSATVALPAESLRPVDSAVPSSCLYNSDSSVGSAAPRTAAYPPSPNSVSADPEANPNATSRWMGPFEQQEATSQGCGTHNSAPSTAAAAPSKVETASAAPQSAADLFAQAEALCESQHFAEAAELFRMVLAALRASDERDTMRTVEAEVWAHLGVAMQSLDDIAAAIESYSQAVRMDPSLHVCFANLATLYMYLEDFDKAEEHILKALELEPENPAYLEIKASMRSRSGSASRCESLRLPGLEV